MRAPSERQVQSAMHEHDGRGVARTDVDVVERDTIRDVCELLVELLPLGDDAGGGGGHDGLVGSWSKNELEPGSRVMGWRSASLVRSVIGTAFCSRYQRLPFTKELWTTCAISLSSDAASCSILRAKTSGRVEQCPPGTETSAGIPVGDANQCGDTSAQSGRALMDGTRVIYFQSHVKLYGEQTKPATLQDHLASHPEPDSRDGETVSELRRATSPDASVFVPLRR